MSSEFWIQMVVYALSMGALGGTILTKIGYLEKKMDAFGELGERVAVAEQSTKSAHYRIDELAHRPVRQKKVR